MTSVGCSPAPAGLVGYAVDEHSVAGDVQDCHLRRMCRIGGRVGEDGRRNGLGKGGWRNAESCENDGQEQVWEAASGRCLHGMILL